jgi:hypothetical protein
MPARPSRWIVIAAVALGVAASASASASATAAASHGDAEPSSIAIEGWHVGGVYRGYPGSVDGGLQLQAIAAVSSTTAWVAGNYGRSLTVREWNGKTWRSLAVPPGLSPGAGSEVAVFDSVLAASSARDMWTFPQALNTKGPSAATYGLHWTGASWAKYTFPGDVWPLTAADFGPANAWLFGQTRNQNGQAFAYAARWNGSTWQTVRAPGPLRLLSAPAPDDMWGLAGNHVAQWTGTAWRTVSLPGLPALGANARWQPTGIVALGPDNVWVSEVPLVSPSQESHPPVSAALLHWNGTGWTITTDRPPGGENNGSLAYGGASGFWLTVGEGDLMANPAILLNDRNGTWSRQLAPTKPGYTDYSVSLLTRIPGTGSLWAVAEFDNLHAGETDTAILKYGP